MVQTIVPVLFILGMLAQGPAAAQTEVDCRTVADILAESLYAGASSRLYATYTDKAQVADLVRSRFGEAAVEKADTVQVFYLGEARYLVMASLQGCHIAHAFTEDPK